jgi:hypothetical protein
MPDFYKPLLNIAADWLTTVTRRNLRQKNRAERVQAKTLPRLIRPLAKTRRGQQLGITPGMSAEAFRHKVPLADHQQIEPWIEQVKSGAADLIWPGTCSCFAATAGTTTGTPRHLPVTTEMQACYSAGARAAILHATARAGGVYALLGRVLLLGGSVSTNQLDDEQSAAIADLATLAAVQQPHWVERFYLEPSARIALRQDWDDFVERVVKRTRSKPVSMIGGQPAWVRDFARKATAKLSAGKVRYTSLRAIWPQLRCIVLTGDFSSQLYRQLKAAAGDGVELHEVFATTEGFIAAQDPGSVAGLRLLAETGIYFEFLPVEDYDPSKLAELGFKAVSLAKVKVDRLYLLVLTTPAGLVRHITGDVVRITSVRPPRVLPMGQIDLCLNQFGEKLHTRQVIDTLVSVCSRHKWTPTFVHVAPLPTRTELGVVHGSHEWWVELQSGTVDTPRGPALASELDRSLRESHEGYRSQRQQGNLMAPLVRLVMPGAFEHWLRHKRRWGGPHKLAITRNDRQIADSLSRMARFSKD